MLTQEHKDKISAAQKGEKGNMWGKHHLQKTKDKISIALVGRISPMKGKKQSQKAKDKCSTSMKGKQNRLGWIQTQKERDAHSKSMQGKQNRLGIKSSQEACDNISRGLKGNKNSVGKNLGKNNHNWNGGYDICRARREKVRREFGFIPLNDKFAGSDAHHLDEEFVVYIPHELHNSIYHSVTKDINMEEINALALNFVYGD